MRCAQNRKDFHKTSLDWVDSIGQPRISWNDQDVIPDTWISWQTTTLHVLVVVVSCDELSWLLPK